MAGCQAAWTEGEWAHTRIPEGHVAEVTAAEADRVPHVVAAVDADLNRQR